MKIFDYFASGWKNPIIMYWIIFIIMAPAFNLVEGYETLRYCAATYSNETHLSEDVAEVLHQSHEFKNQKIQCSRDTRSCYTLWRIENTKPNGTVFIIISQGCWEASSLNDCSVGVCNPLPSNKEFRKNGFCCCTGDFCNMNVNFTMLKTFDSTNRLSNEKTVQEPSGSSKGTHEDGIAAVTGPYGKKALVLGGCASLLLLLIIILLTRRWPAPANVKQKAHQDQRHSLSPNRLAGQSVNNSYSLAHLNLDRVIGQGRYGTVWLGRVKDHQVAVKMFPPHYSNYFYNEKDIYTLPFMEHSSFLTYHGCDEIKRKDGDARLVLVLSYCPLGNLQEYLKKNIIDVVTFAKMVFSVSTGLAYLHTEIHKQGKWKPCVTHRDINTRNILVKEDLSCCIADLGLAVKITGCRYYNLGEEQHAEAKSINDVGTLRYMAPEVLEGAVNLRDCESSLKQIDVYALGLVLWEVSMRVADFYVNTLDVPEYSLPFEKEVGQHPTLEDMQILVCRNKARPLFSSEWKNIQATRIVKETVEDCTDQDGEARLTALCVQERMSQIYKGAVQVGGISPTLNQTCVFSYNYSYNCNPNLEVGEVVTDKEVTDGGISEGTVETMITMSPSESYNSNVNFLVKDLWGAVAQPYQGRNTCLERNLLTSGSNDEEVFVVETSRKHEKVDFIGEAGLLVPNRLPSPYYNTVQLVQNKTVSPKKVNSEITQIQPKQNTDDSNGSFTRVIVSPFENARVNCNSNTNSLRPSSLDILTTTSAKDYSFPPDDDEDSKRLKELSGRIRTPGDLPPSVRRTRGSRQAARLSLYDDRIMTCSRLIDTTF